MDLRERDGFSKSASNIFFLLKLLFSVDDSDLTALCRSSLVKVSYVFLQYVNIRIFMCV